MRLRDRIIELECEMKRLKSVGLYKGENFYYYNLIDVVAGIVHYLDLEPAYRSEGVSFKKKEKGNCGKLGSD